MMIDSVVWAQYINVTDSHVAIANDAPTRCFVWKKVRNKIKHAFTSTEMTQICFKTDSELDH